MHAPLRLGCLALLAAPVVAQSLAWCDLAWREHDVYRGTGYRFLGDGDLRLVIDVAPADHHALEILWGSKADERGARVIVQGVAIPWSGGGWDGFRWRRLELPDGLGGDAWSIELRAAEPRAGFLAGVRLVDRSRALDEAPSPPVGAQLIRVLPSRADLLRARGAQANEAFRRCRDFVRGWLAHADPTTGLIPRNLSSGRTFWNGQDAAADNYPFMVLTAALTDRAMFEGRMLDMLRTETRLTSRIGALPDDWSFETQTFRHQHADLDRLIFAGSEYVKDGLMPLTEWLGPSPWSERMVAIADSIVAHAPVETPAGRIPSTNGEVNGELMQVLGRLSFMTGDERYLDAAIRIADYYLLQSGNHPSRDADRLQLRDHGCELISGLTEVYAACATARPERAAAYRAPLHELFDRVLEVGRNEHGLFFDLVNPRTGVVLRDTIGDNWGYDLNGVYTLFLVDGVERYRDATRLALENLAPHYLEFPWQGWGSDGIADSVEGAINLYQREPIAGVDAWIDANIERMFAIQRHDGVIEGWHGDGNFARTALMWALWKQQGVTVQPWRADLRLGAMRDGDSVELLLESDWAWSGRLIFDQPRHRTVMHLPLDYPRINQFPEWFAVDAAATYDVQRDTDPARTLAGSALLSGLPVVLQANRTLRLRVTR